MNEVLQISDDTNQDMQVPLKVDGLVMTIKKITTSNNGVMQILLEGAATPASIPDTSALIALQHIELVNVSLESCED